MEKDEGEYIAEEALEGIPATIVESQKLIVDNVSGATYSSNAILEAVKDCITQAGGNVDELLK